MSDIQAIKYRLVGAVVVVVGFALLWSVMLDHEAKRRVEAGHVEVPPQTFNVERFDIQDPQPLHPEATANAELPVSVEDPAAEKPSAEAAVAEVKPVETAASPVVNTPAEKTAVAVVDKPVNAKPVDKPAPKPEVSKAATPEKAHAPQSPGYAALDAKGVPEAWVIQLASLKSKENAQKLQKELLGYGFPAYVKSVNKPEGVSFRVLVGPKLNRQKAEEMAKAIEKKQGSKGMIVKFQAGYEQ